MKRVAQVWLEQRLDINERGNYVIAGDCGLNRIEVELDPDITTGIALADRPPALLSVHGRIQNAARAKHQAGAAFLVGYPYSGQVSHYLIALTQSDLAAA